jgi:hypothetical protein
MCEPLRAGPAPWQDASMPTTSLAINTGTVIRVQPVAAWAGDPDWTLAQDYAAAEASGVVSYPANRGAVSVAITIEAYDATGAKVTGDRGSFTITPIRLIPGDGTVHDSAPTEAALAWKRYVVDDAGGVPALVGVRISVPVPPVGATELRIFGEVLSASVS